MIDRMLRGALLACASFALPCLALAQTEPPPDTVVAIIDGQPLRRADVIESASNLPAPYQQQMEQIFPALIERLIDLKLLAEEGRRRNLQDDAGVRAEVAKFEEQAIREALLDQFLKERVTEDEIKKRYDEMVKAYQPEAEIRARHILVAEEATAKEIIAELEGGADFIELAKTKSIDAAAAQQGGDLGYFVKEQMVPEFADAAFALQVGEYTKQPVKTRFGWHIIKVEDKRNKPPPTLEEAREGINSELSQELVGTLLAELRSKSEIQRFNPDGTPIQQTTPPAGGESGGSGQ
jgi:peptidyl-prolyl cis-trans isomerase C